ncbi:MAG: hypothetical protein JXB33_06420, partial [Clostridia bacterium]|nr:hypothetical protein [Clostridia bacterium]
MKKIEKQLCLLMAMVLFFTYTFTGCKKKTIEESPTPGITGSPTPTPGPSQSLQPEKPPEGGEKADPWISAEDLNKPPSNL